MLQSHALKDMDRKTQLVYVQKFQGMALELTVKHEMMGMNLVEMVEALTL